MLVRIPKVLTAEELASARATLAGAHWADGRITAGHQSAKAKHNLQLPEDSDAASALRDLVMHALERNPHFMAAALPRHVFPPLFNRYQAGMGFGNHVDNAIRQLPGSAQRLRTDVSSTLFLSAPEDYDGGELIIEDTFGTHAVKLAAGEMIVYPASSLHRVAPVTRGHRDAAFFWTQSLVKDGGERTLLFEMDRALIELSATQAADSEAVVRLTACYHNLVRKWAEM